MNLKGKLYGVGIGPGDPELLTLKAVRLLREADVIAAPDTGGEARTALNIVSDYIQNKPILNCPTPMTRDPKRLEQAWEVSTALICEQLDFGKNVVFITLGDPTIYSTYLYIHRRVLDRGYSAELIPGVPSFCAAAAKLNLSLCEGNERLLIVPASHDSLQESLNFSANKVLMKSGRQLSKVKEILRTRNELDNASMVANCGLEGEYIQHSFAAANTDSSYFSIVIVKNNDKKTKDIKSKTEAPQPPHYHFPMFTSLVGKKIVIIGGGTIARRRINTLLPFGGDITVIAPQLSGSTEGITWLSRPYQSGDLSGAFLAVAATDQRAVNHAVFEEAQQKKIPISVADNRRECSFFFPAVCTGEKVLAGVVSRGDDHHATAAAAKRIRQVIDAD